MTSGLEPLSEYGFADADEVCMLMMSKLTDQPSLINIYISCLPQHRHLWHHSPVSYPLRLPSYPLRSPYVAPRKWCDPNPPALRSRPLVGQSARGSSADSGVISEIPLRTEAKCQARNGPLDRTDDMIPQTSEEEVPNYYHSLSVVQRIVL